MKFAYIAIIVAFLFCYYMFIPFRLVIKNPIATVYYGIKDLRERIIHHTGRNCPTGQIIAYTALFGGGKTLSVVHYVTTLFYRYDGLKVWDRDRKKFVTQKIHVISNVDLVIPYEKFVSLEQIVRVADKFHEMDLQNDTLTVTVVLGDEFSVQLNSREFKKNIDPLFLNTLLTCRHHHILMVYDAQRFNHVDALLRQVTLSVIECKKVWRFMIQYEFDAYEMENAVNPLLLTPKARYGWVIRDADYQAYDTLACVGNLKKSCEKGDMLSEEDILKLQCNNGTNMEAVTSPSKTYRKSRKKLI
jgi:hypothetical protein